MKLSVEGTLGEIKELLQAIGSSKEQRCICCEDEATLELENSTFICETCAQIQGELA